MSMRTNGPLQPPPTQRPTPPWVPDISALETGALGDPSTFLVTALARSTAGPATSTDDDTIAMLATDLLPPSPAASTPSPPLLDPPRLTDAPDLAGSPHAAGWADDRGDVRESIRRYQQEAARLRRKADELQALLQHEAHETQTL